MADTLATLIVKLSADTAEMTTGLNKATHSLDAFAANTVDVAAASKDLGRSFESAMPHSSALTASLKSFDGVLGSLGIHIGPEIKALGELGSVAGKTASQLGVVATVGLAAGAAFGGWKLGRMIADWLDLDDKIGKVTASLMGFGDEAAEIAQSGGLKLLHEAVTRFRETFDAAGANMTRVRGEVADAQRAYRHLSEEQRANIGDMLEWGKSASEVEQLLKLTTGTVDVYIERMKLKAEQDKIATKAAEDHANAIKRIRESQQTFIDLAPLKPKDVTIGDAANPFNPEGAYKQHLDEAAATREWAEAQAEANRQMEEGLLIVGEYPNAHKAAAEAGVQGANDVTAAFQRMGEAFQLAVPRDFDWTKAYGDAGIVTHGSIGGIIPKEYRAGGGGGITVNIHDSMLDTPEGINRMADKVGHVITQRLRGSGTAVR